MPVREQSIRILGVPLDLGQALRGVDMGASAVRYAGLRRSLRALGHRVQDAGNLAVPVRDFLDEEADPSFMAAIARVCAELADATDRAVADGCVPLVLGGDHSISIGSVSGVVRHGRVGVLWIDAHGDLNTPDSSPSGNIHGMSLAALLGHGPATLVELGGPGPKVRPEDVAMIGVRDLDEGEKDRVRTSGIAVYTMREVDERGIGTVVREALERVSGADRLHVSLDLDSLDPSEAPGVGTPVHGGLTYREALLICELIADCGRLGSLDVVEVNPILDERNETAQTAVALVESLFGKSIL